MSVLGEAASLLETPAPFREWVDQFKVPVPWPGPPPVVGYAHRYDPPGAPLFDDRQNSIARFLRERVHGDLRVTLQAIALGKEREPLPPWAARFIVLRFSGAASKAPADDYWTVQFYLEKAQA